MFNIIKTQLIYYVIVIVYDMFCYGLFMLGHDFGFCLFFLFFVLWCVVNILFVSMCWLLLMVVFWYALMFCDLFLCFVLWFVLCSCVFLVLWIYVSVLRYCLNALWFVMNVYECLCCCECFWFSFYKLWD